MSRDDLRAFGVKVFDGDIISSVDKRRNIHQLDFKLIVQNSKNIFRNPVISFIQ